MYNFSPSMRFAKLYFAEIDFKVATKFDFIQMHSEKAQFGDLK